MAQIDLGNVVGPQGATGPKGDDYVLTSQDKQDIAELVGEGEFLPNAVVNIDVYNESSSQYPDIIDYIPALITIKDSNGNVLTTRNTNSQRVTLRVAPLMRLVVSVEAEGFETLSDKTITSQPGEVTLDFAATPSADVHYQVVYKNGDTILYSESVLPHANSVYGGVEPTSEGKIWDGWDKPTTNIITNTTINAVFITPTEPEEIKDLELYDFIYSDKATDNMAYTKAEFAYILLNNLGETYLTIGKRIKMLLNSTVMLDDEIIFRLEDFNHMRRTDNNELAKTCWGMFGLMTSNKKMNNSNTNAGGYPATEMARFLEEDLFPTFEPFWRSIIRQVKVLSSAGSQTARIVETNAHIYLYSHAEVGFDVAATPYKQEIDEEADHVNFPYYVSSATRIKYYFNGTGSASTWWLRSPDTTSFTNFRYVHSNGIAYSANASNSYGVSFCFNV